MATFGDRGTSRERADLEFASSRLLTDGGSKKEGRRVIAEKRDTKLSATDVLAPITMKNAANCDTSCDLQNPVNHQNFERTLRFRDMPGSMLVRVSLNTNRPPGTVTVTFTVTVTVTGGRTMSASLTTARGARHLERDRSPPKGRRRERKRERERRRELDRLEGR